MYSSSRDAFWGLFSASSGLSPYASTSAVQGPGHLYTLPGTIALQPLNVLKLEKFILSLRFH